MTGRPPAGLPAHRSSMNGVLATGLPGAACRTHTAYLCAGRRVSQHANTHVHTRVTTGLWGL